MNLFASGEALLGAIIVLGTVTIVWLFRDKTGDADLQSFVGSLRIALVPVGMLLALIVGVVLMLSGFGMM